MRISKPPLCMYQVNNPKWKAPKKKYPVNHAKVNITKWIGYLVTISVLGLILLRSR